MCALSALLGKPYPDRRLANPVPYPIEQIIQWLNHRLTLSQKVVGKAHCLSSVKKTDTCLLALRLARPPVSGFAVAAVTRQAYPSLCRRSVRSQLEAVEQFGFQPDPVGSLAEIAAADQEGILDALAQRRDLCRMQIGTVGGEGHRN